MKTNRSKGFTLIELMVVISIIALLSSIVLASIKSAREKAIITKTVSEMKSLQTALELYRTQNGKYPGVNYSNYSDSTGVMNTSENIDTFFTTELVNKKFISKVPHAPFYPTNSCNQSGLDEEGNEFWEDCYSTGYILGYHILKPNTSFYNLKCGDKIVNDYSIYLFANSKTVNLPTLKYARVDNGVTVDYFPYGPVYCVGM